MDAINAFKTLCNVDFEENIAVVRRTKVEDIVPSNWIGNRDVVIDKPYEWTMNRHNLTTNNRQYRIHEIIDIDIIKRKDI